MMKKTIFLTILFMSIFMTSTIIYADTLLPKVIETTIGSIPEGYKIIPESVKMSDDMRQIAFAAYSDSTHNIVQTNNYNSPVYYAVQPNMPIWDLYSTKCAYIAYKNKESAVIAVNDKIIDNIDNADNFIFNIFGSRYACRAQKNDRQFVIVNGKPGKSYDGILIKDNFYFSPDGERLIYVAVKNNSCVAVVDGQEEPQAFTLIENARFSLDSTHYAYKGRIKGSTMSGKEKWCVVKDGQAGNIYDHIYDLIFSNDSKHLAYTAIKDRKMVLVFDGHEMAPHDRVGLPIFSFNAKAFAYAYADKDKWYVLLNDKEMGPFDKIFKFNFSHDSKRNSLIAINDDAWFCTVDGVKGPDFQKMIESFKFSLDSSRYVYVGADETGARVVTDGKRSQKYLAVGEPYFSPDSKHLVYRALRPGEESWITVLDGKESSIEYYGIGKYQFSPDSKHLAYPATDSTERSLMIVDGVEQCSDQNFKILGDPTFSPDGNYIVYHARAGDEKWHLIVNGQVLPEVYGGFYKGTPILFDSPTQFHTIGINPGGTEFVVIDVDIPETLKLTSGLNNTL
jgi:hypothetical protein